MPGKEVETFFNMLEYAKNHGHIRKHTYLFRNGKQSNLSVCVNLLF